MRDSCSSGTLPGFPIGLDFVTQVFAICAAHRSVYFLVREPLEGLVEKDCNIMVSNYLVSYLKGFFNLDHADKSE